MGDDDVNAGTARRMRHYGRVCIECTHVRGAQCHCILPYGCHIAGEVNWGGRSQQARGPERGGGPPNRKDTTSVMESSHKGHATQFKTGGSSELAHSGVEAPAS